MTNVNKQIPCSCHVVECVFDPKTYQPFTNPLDDIAASAHGAAEERQPETYFLLSSLPVGLQIRAQKIGVKHQIESSMITSRDLTDSFQSNLVVPSQCLALDKDRI